MQQTMETPKTLKLLIGITAGANLFTALLSGMVPGLHLDQILGLSATGLKTHCFWQLVTYLFTQEAQTGISFSLLFRIAFNAYILWVVGKEFIQKKGVFNFLAIYFLSGLIGGLAAVGLKAGAALPQPIFGNLTALYGLLIAWITFNPNVKILFFIAIPIRAKNLILAYLGINLLIDISSGQTTYALSYIVAAIVGHLYALPFKKPSEKEHSYTRGKIYDFKTGKAILSDEQFLEEMLSKISLHGKKSLTWREKWRIRQIARRKKKG